MSGLFGRRHSGFGPASGFAPFEDGGDWRSEMAEPLDLVSPTVISDGLRSAAVPAARPDAALIPGGGRRASPSRPDAAFDTSGLAQQVAEGAAVERALGDDAIPTAAAGDAMDPAPSHEAVQEEARFTAALIAKFRRAEVGEPDFDSSLEAGVRRPFGTSRPDAGLMLAVTGIDAEAVAVADVDDCAGEGRAPAQVSGHGASAWDRFARISAGRNGESKGENGQQGGGDEGQDGAHAPDFSALISGAPLFRSTDGRLWTIEFFVGPVPATEANIAREHARIVAKVAAERRARQSADWGAEPLDWRRCP